MSEGQFGPASDVLCAVHNILYNAPMKTSAPKKSSQQITADKFQRLQWDPALKERKTTTDHIASALRTAIYDGQFADGEELNQVELAQYFNVSRVPIREALRQLQAEGLVRIVAHHRTVVAGLTVEDIVGLIEMRAVLEGHMVRKSAPHLDVRALARLHKLCDEMDRITDYGSHWVLKNWEFHQTLYGAGSSKTMIELVERIHLKIERYARQAGTDRRLREAAAEHRSILGHIERKDYAAASTQIEQHVLNTGEEIRRYRERAG
jgi:DNA-binding GntR family transcriptional regulator